MEGFHGNGADFGSHFTEFNMGQEFESNESGNSSSAKLEHGRFEGAELASHSDEARLKAEDGDKASGAQPKDGKPRTKRTRATGEALNILKREFDENPNPNAQNRKRISELTGLPEKNVRIWFQNRRAKHRKTDRHNSRPSAVDMGGFGNLSPAVDFDRIPLEANSSYSFVDVSSLTVGSWKRLKSGNLKADGLHVVQDLSNLSPISINEMMANATDLMVLISKKNLEINYFFSAIAKNTKILFRIFFPISSVVDCSLSVETDSIPRDTEDQDDSDSYSKNRMCELKLNVSKPPKFAVYFSDVLDQFSSNQWSICEDFSEGRQVSDAFVGGSNIPHILTGLEDSLKLMNSLILDFNSTNQMMPPQQSQPQQQVHMPDSQQPLILHPEPHAVETRSQPFFDEFNRQDELYGLKEENDSHPNSTHFVSPGTVQSHSFPPHNTSSHGSDLVPSSFNEPSIPRTPEFLKHSTELSNEDQNGLNSLLIFDDQSNSGTTNAQNYF